MRNKQIIITVAVLLILVTGYLLYTSRDKQPVSQQPENNTPSTKTLTEQNPGPDVQDFSIGGQVLSVDSAQLRLMTQRVVSSDDGNVVKDEEKFVDIVAAIYVKVVTKNGKPTTAPAVFADLKKAKEVIVHTHENPFGDQTIKAFKVEIVK